jgi:hypothetical protein
LPPFNVPGSPEGVHTHPTLAGRGSKPAGNLPPFCRHCGTVVPHRLTWQLFADGTLHIRATCTACGRFGEYAAQTPGAVTAVDSGDEQPEL